MKLIARIFKILAMSLLVVVSPFQLVQANEVKVEVSNFFADGGLALTLAWTGFHDGTFDPFNSGVNASTTVQALAKNGDMSGIRANFATTSCGINGAVFGPEGFTGTPVIELGEITAAFFDINNIGSRYFSFLSMLRPTNDAFIGNENPDQYSLFDMLGNFVGLDILVLGSRVWDAGTKANIGFDSPFLAGANSQGRQGENATISKHSGGQVLAGGLSIISGTTPLEYTIDELAANFTAAGCQITRIKITQVAKVSDPAVDMLTVL